MLEIRELIVRYGKFLAVNAVSLDVAPGTIVGLIGPNGAGKSSIVRAVAGLVAASEGAILFNAADMAGLQAYQRVRIGISLVPEGRGLFPQMSVEENLKMGGYSLRDAASLRAELDRTYVAFPLLKHRRHQLAGTMSGGQQQLLALAVGLMCDPKLLILDEPSLGVAPIVIDTIAEALMDMKRAGRTILLVEQNVTLAATVTDRVYVMQSGAIHHAGTTEEIVSNPAIAEAFLAG